MEAIEVLKILKNNIDKAAAEGANCAIETIDIELIDRALSLHNVKQQRELLNAFAFYMVKNSNPNDGMTHEDYVEQWLSI